ncbi:RES domain-containing protein [Umezawaea sp. Da 62-37]|uniref:RES domain-containing protein n=1 Tax=Umezawaea sp. Da 62-37 TaxID=3075927 RepID=UPI0028F74099|nr:RES domain-containing protein [Umezawaea sp. Da 62-37]WNV85316.1 RES domain-containing protein [Umezawaea sp. Da 62-37]
MPRIEPPAEFSSPPAEHVLPAGTRLWRVHGADMPAVQFDPPHHLAFGGRRFDGVGASGHPVLYASENLATAVCERVLPEVDFTPLAPRMLPTGMLTGEVLTAVETTVDLPLLRLVSSVDLAKIGQDDWLVRDKDFSLTREWGAWLHDRLRTLCGIVWQSSPDMPHPTLVLFGDRCAGVLREVPESRRPLDAPRAPNWLADILAERGVDTRSRASGKRKVFLNYRTGDGDLAALMLHAELADRFGEESVFRAADSIPLGTDYRQELEDGVRGSKVLLAIIGRNWETSCDAAGNQLLADPEDWVRKEILLAWDSNVKVIPVLVGARPRMKPDALPVELGKLAFTTGLHLPSGPGEIHVRALVEDLLNRLPDLR